MGEEILILRDDVECGSLDKESLIRSAGSIRERALMRSREAEEEMERGRREEKLVGSSIISISY